MAAAAAYRPPLSRALTSYMESTQTNYNVPTSGPDYHTVCGRNVGATNGTPSPSGSRVLDQFKEQIGCPSTGGPLEWKEKRDKFKDQFNKAKLCFSGRVRGLQGHAMTNNASRLSRKTHAYAAQAAYVVGRDCLRKIADVPTALHRYNTSARELINDVSTDDPGIKEALNAEFPIDPDREGSTTNPILEVGTPVNPLLKTVYEKTYGLSRDQWELYHKFLQYSALKADSYAYDTTNIRASIPTIAEVEHEFKTEFSPTPFTPPPPPSPPPTTTPLRHSTSKKSTRKASKKNSKEGVTGGGTARHTATKMEEDVLLNRLAEMRLNTVTPPTGVTPITTASISLPVLESIVGDAYMKLKDDASKLSFNLDYMVTTWMISVVELIKTLQKKENHTPENLELFTRTVLMPYQYYKTFVAIRTFQLNYIKNGAAILTRPNLFISHSKLVSKIFPIIQTLGSNLKPLVSMMNKRLKNFKAYNIEPIISLSDMETIKRDYQALEKYTDMKLLEVLEANKKNPELITLNNIWPYIPPTDTPAEIQDVIKQLKHLKLPITTNLFRHTAT